jgi:pimeloyl-ACP methyl ester carboxylesterase
MKNLVLLVCFLGFILTGSVQSAPSSSSPGKTRTIVLIHGLFMNPKSWDTWKKYYESMGYACYAPAYPYHDGDPAVLRKKIDPRLGTLSFKQTLDSLAAFIDRLPEKPILIGHSMGGLFVQKLISMGKGVAGVCIDTAPPQGLFSFKPSFLMANLPTINPFKGNTPCLPSVKWYQYAFCNTMTLRETGVEYDKFVVPESRNIPRDSTTKDGHIDFSLPHSPLLFIAGEKDHIVPSSLNMKNYKAYTDKGSKKEYRVFSGRTHYICGQKNWEEIAAFILAWTRDQ